MKKIIFLFILAALPAFGAYTYHRSITVDHTKVSTANQVSFPVLVAGTYPALATVANGGHVQNSSGFDVSFASDASCTTPIPWEVESWSATTGAVNYWVNPGTVSFTVDTVFYMCYGDSSISTDRSTPTAVWDANYKGVWHKPGSTANAKDSTSNANDGTANGVTDAAGQINGGGAYSGTAQFVNVGNGASLQIIGDLTIEAWINPTDLVNYNGIFKKMTNWPAPYDLYINQTDGAVYFGRGNGSSANYINSISAIATGVWTHLAAYSTGGTTGAIYANGVAIAVPQALAFASPTDGGSAALIGNRNGLNTMFKGGLDEVRISNIARTSAWITTSYNNQSSPSTFYALGIEIGPPAAYSYHRSITVDHTKVSTANQVSFPVLVSGTYSSLATVANGGHVQNSSGFDVVFTSDAGCTTPIPWEVESWSATTGAVNYWVNPSIVSSTVDTVFYICYGNTTISTNQSTPTAVWDANYKGVWHKPGFTINAIDSTANANNGTATGVTDAAGKVNGGGAYSGTSQYLNVGNGASLQITGDLTIEAWINPTDFVNYNGIFGKSPAGQPAPYDLFLNTSSGMPSFGRGNGTTSAFINAASAVGTGVWTHLAAYSTGGTTGAIYANGAAIAAPQALAFASPTDGGAPAFIGSRNDHGTMFKGGLDEVRISNIARSPSWIITSYNNQSSPSTFYSLGIETGISAVNLAATSTINLIVTLSGVSTSWTPGAPGSPVFVLSGGTGASIFSQQIISANSATVTVAAGSSTGFLTITDPSTSNTASFNSSVTAIAPAYILFQ